MNDASSGRLVYFAHTLGLVCALVILPAHLQDRDGAKLAHEAFRESVKFPKVIWADTAYRSV